MTADAIRLDPTDDVATALRTLEPGTEAVVSGPGGEMRLAVAERVPAFHKIAVAALPVGAPVRKYGAVIGALTAAVAAGGLVHVHNLTSLRARGEGAVL